MFHDKKDFYYLGDKEQVVDVKRLQYGGYAPFEQTLELTRSSDGPIAAWTTIKTCLLYTSEIDDGKKAIEDGKAEIETNRANANYQFSQAEQQIEESKELLAENKDKFEE